jgi:hypothetical protein
MGAMVDGKWFSDLRVGTKIIVVDGEGTGILIASFLGAESAI